MELNPGVRNTALATGTVTRTNPLVGTVGEWAASVVTLDQRRLHRLQHHPGVGHQARLATAGQARLSYAFSRGRGNTATGQADTADSQFLGDLNLDNEVRADRRRSPAHPDACPARYDVPQHRRPEAERRLQRPQRDAVHAARHHVRRDRNGITANEYLPAGTYRRRAARMPTRSTTRAAATAARGPNYQRLDFRAGYRIRLAGGRTIDAFLDVFNVTNRAELREPEQRPPRDGDVPEDHADPQRESDPHGADQFALRVLRLRRRLTTGGQEIRS